MMETVLKVKVDEFLAHKIGDIVKKGAFKSEDEFLKSAVEDMVRRWEILELNTKMDKFAERIAKKQPKSVSEAVLKAREEEDETL
jgi:Arc/MetJ-type ribon-helix-helix transcriptional regulator